MRRTLIALTVLGMALVAAQPSLAGGRPDKDWKNWFGQIAAGYSFGQGTFGDIVDDDFYINGGATYWPDDWGMGINLDVSYDDRDISGAAIRAINDALAAIDPLLGSVAGGDVRTWGFSVNAIWSPKSSGGAGFYLIGGVGFDDIKARLLDNGLVYYPPVCDPWYWWCVPGGVGPGTIVVGQTSSTEFTWNAGLGWSFELSSGSQIYLEAKYKSAETDRESTETVPFVLGFRW